ncbi:hypothetical protein RRG08_046835 [Elysia crispata]|uniref:Uncharacterized protein n=1 Tax=Elysia crispata TaxID=231223 RepID=A0AAE0ZMU1_9GAST|nr:hypothetical protein RRG08_046835 [Elysia crispata]
MSTFSLAIKFTSKNSGSRHALRRGFSLYDIYSTENEHGAHCEVHSIKQDIASSSGIYSTEKEHRVHGIQRASLLSPRMRKSARDSVILLGICECVGLCACVRFKTGIYLS